MYEVLPKTSCGHVKHDQSLAYKKSAQVNASKEVEGAHRQADLVVRTKKQYGETLYMRGSG